MSETSRSMGRGQQTVVVLAVLIVVVAAAYLAAGVTDLVEFEPFTVEEFMQQIAGLFLVTLFVERVVEVFISGSRGPDERMLVRAVEEATPMPVEETEASEIHPQMESTAVTTARDDLALFRAKTRRVAFTASVLLGLAAALLGVRALSLFIDVPEFHNLREGQREAFQAFDVILTAGLIAGGSDGMHQLVETFTGYLDKVKSGMKAPSS